MTTSAVQVDCCIKRYGDFVAADRVSLEIAKGEFFTLLGSSGSGKTTTLRMIAGFERPDEGRILINGVDVTRLPAHRRDVHTVFQDYALFPHMTVFNNVAFAPKLKGISRQKIREEVMRAIEVVQLTGFERRKPVQLSGGQQQRVALARAIVDRPAVLLLDEPLSALDAKIRAEVRDELKSLQRATGITFIYVTHDQEEALTMSDRMAVMRLGKVLQVGTPLAVYEHPADLFVAQFIGKANFIDGHFVESSERRATIDTPRGRAEAMLAAPLTAGDRAIIMIRPENLRITPGNSPDAGVIRLANYLGHGTEYLIERSNHTYRALELRRRGAKPYNEGQTVDMSWNWDEALVYRADS
jgi:spermidine/putrescine transport system ATP-binding protein